MMKTTNPSDYRPHGLRPVWSLGYSATLSDTRKERIMNESLHKHSKRTVRRPCEKCGATQLYWAHDMHQPGTRCDDCNVSGKWVLIETDGNRHVCGEAKAPNPFVKPEVVQPEMKFDIREFGAKVDAVAKAIEQAPAAQVRPPAPAPDAAFAAFQTLIGSMAPALDRAEVLALVKQELDGFVFPTRTVVVQPNGDTKPIEGVTHSKVADVLTDLTAGEHVMMVGPAGTGKSTIASQCAEALGFAYYSISLSPMTPASQILGYMQAAGEYVRSLYREAFEHGGVFHFDEIDNAHPSVLAVINASLANGHMAFPDRMVARHADFRCVASANTYGKGADRAYVGRQQIDAATLDRFTIETIEIDEALETQLCTATGVEPVVQDKVLKTVRRYRRNAATKGMTVVISPRASVGMCRLLAAGKDWDAAIEARVRRGMSDGDWAKVTAS